MPTNVYPYDPIAMANSQPQHIPFSASGHSLGPSLSIQENVLGSPLTMFVRLTMNATGGISPICTFNVLGGPPAVAEPVNAPGTPNPITVPIYSNDPAPPTPPTLLANIAAFDRDPADGTYLFQITYAASSGTGYVWFMQIDNRDILPSGHDFVWVVSDTADGTKVPWIDVKPKVGALPIIFDFKAFTGQDGTIAQLNAVNPTVYNYGTGALEILAGGPPGFTIPALTVPPNHVVGADLAVTLTTPTSSTPTALGPAVVALATSGSGADPNATSSDGHNNQLTLAATIFNYEIVLLLDASGSMAFHPKSDGTDAPDSGNERWDYLIAASDQFIDMLALLAPASTLFGAAMFPDITAANYGPLHPAPPVSAANLIAATTAAPFKATLLSGLISSGDTTEIKNTIAQFTPQQNCGATPMGQGMTLAMGDYTSASVHGYFADDAASVAFNDRHLLLMSDGAQNSPNANGHPLPVDFALIYGAAPGGKNIKVDTVAYGDPAGAVFMVDVMTLTTIAGDSGGTYYPAYPGAAFDPKASPNVLAKAFRTALVNALTLQPIVDPSGTLTSSDPEVSREVIITPHDSRAVFLVEWNSADRDRISVTITTPNCESITLATKNPNISVVGTSKYALFVFQDAYLRNAADPQRPRYGAWTLDIRLNTRPVEEAPAGKASIDRETYVYDVTTDSRLRLKLTTDRKAYYAGDPIELTAMLSLDGYGIAHATVFVEATTPERFGDNFLANTPVTAKEYEAAAAQLANADTNSVGVKAFALRKKGLVFEPLDSQNVTQLLDLENIGVYTATLPAPSTPGTYGFTVIAIGETQSGVLFRREQRLSLYLGVRPVPQRTLIDAVYTQVVVRGQTLIQGTVKITPRDSFGNAVLFDPATNPLLRITPPGVLVGGIVDNHDGSYTQVVRFSPDAPPSLGISVGDVGLPVFTVPHVDDLVYVSSVIAFQEGRQALAGGSQHANPAAALGSVVTKPATQFLSLGGRGVATFGFKTGSLSARAVTVFVEPDAAPRSYRVDVLSNACRQWVTIGESAGITQTFTLMPTAPKSASHHVEDRRHRRSHDRCSAWIDHDGSLSGDPSRFSTLHRLGLQGIKAIRIVDESGVVTNSDGTASSTPGISIRGIGFTRP